MKSAMQTTENFYGGKSVDVTVTINGEAVPAQVEFESNVIEVSSLAEGKRLQGQRVLDVLFREDHCRKRKENAAENFNFIRKMALNIIRKKKDGKKSLRRKRLNAAWHIDYLENLIKF